MNHVSVSPTDGNGPTQGQRQTLTRVGIEPYRLSYKVRREQALGTDDIKVTAMNMYEYKKGLRFFKRWPCSSIPTLVRVFLCPCVGPFPSVGLTLTYFIWGRYLALHITL